MNVVERLQEMARSIVARIAGFQLAVGRVWLAARPKIDCGNIHDRFSIAKASTTAGFIQSNMPKGGENREVANLKLVLDHPLQQLHFLRHFGIAADLVLDLAYGMKHRGMVAPAKTPPDFR